MITRLYRWLNFPYEVRVILSIIDKEPERIVAVNPFLGSTGYIIIDNRTTVNVGDDSFSYIKNKLSKIKNKSKWKELEQLANGRKEKR